MGIEAYRIPIKQRNLLDDKQFWVGQGTYQPDEIAAQFHHRLV